MSRAGLLAALLLAFPSLAQAQRYVGAPLPRPGTFEISGGATWTAGYDTGEQSAFESTNSVTGGAPLTLFTSSSRVVSGVGAAARLGVYLSSRWALEGAVEFSRPRLETRLGDDFENASPVTARTRPTSYVIGGSVLYHFASGRIVPFAGGGGGYVRQIYEDNADVVTGSEVHAIGGIKMWFGERRRRFGLRADAEMSSRSRVIGFEQKRRILPVIGGGVIYRF